MRAEQRLAILIAGVAMALGAPARCGAQSGTQPASGPGSMPGMDMSGTEHGAGDAPAAGSADSEMASMHMDMGPHMYMTAMRPANAEDEKRAEKIEATVRQAIAKYNDYHVALADGFKIFAPNVPQEQYHFTSYANAMKAQFVFDPASPTSLLYKKTATGYELVGAMFTAPKSYTEDQLNERVPLSVARWHEHVNLCLPPKGEPLGSVDWKEFGLKGSIATEAACDAAGGRWHAIVFNWMVHVYPFESDPSKVWAH